MKSEGRFYLAALTRCPGFGSRTLRKLLAFYQTARDIWESGPEELAVQGQLTPGAVQRLMLFRREQEGLPEQLEASCRRAGCKLCTIEDDVYPVALKEIYDPPVVLFYRGTIEPDARRIAMVGSRRFTPYGEGLALDFGQRLAAAGLTVVSGAARGIDTASHRGARKAGRTVAVLGCGVDVAYPAENRRLLEDIAFSGGAVISEYGPGTRPLPAFFPARNRIISGLSEGTLVIEAARRSGSLITAEMALSEGRDVFAIPGSVYSDSSWGCNHLIQQGARLVQSPDDILETYGVSAPPKRKSSHSFTAEERQVWQVLSFEHSLTVDEIIQSMPQGELPNLAFILLQMELKGLVIENELHAYRRAERE